MFDPISVLVGVVVCVLIIIAVFAFRACRSLARHRAAASPAPAPVTAREGKVSGRKRIVKSFCKPREETPDEKIKRLTKESERDDRIIFNLRCERAKYEEYWQEYSDGLLREVEALRDVAAKAVEEKQKCERKLNTTVERDDLLDELEGHRSGRELIRLESQLKRANQQVEDATISACKTATQLSTAVQKAEKLTTALDKATESAQVEQAGKDAVLKEVEDLKAHVTAANDEKEALKEENRDLNDTNTTISQERDSLRTEQDRLNRRIEQLENEKADIDSLRTTNSKLQKEKTSLQGRIEEWRKDRIILQDVHEKSCKESETTIESLQKQVADLTGHNNGLASTLTGTAQASVDLKTVQGQLKQANERAQNFWNEIQRLNGQAEKLKGDIQEKATRIYQLNQDVLSEATRKLNNAQTENKRFVLRLQEQGKAMANSNEQATRVQQESDRIQAQASSSATRIHGLASKVQELEKQLVCPTEKKYRKMIENMNDLGELNRRLMDQNKQLMQEKSALEFDKLTCSCKDGWIPPTEDSHASQQQQAGQSSYQLHGQTQQSGESQWAPNPPDGYYHAAAPAPQQQQPFNADNIHPLLRNFSQ